MQETTGVERVVIGVFPQLCQLVGAREPQLRQAVGGVLARVNVGQVLQETQEKCEKAEERAHTAEAKVQKLSEELKNLTQEKEALERQLAVF
jgi:chaperonin cofactor prefoldin